MSVTHSIADGASGGNGGVGACKGGSLPTYFQEQINHI